MQIVRIDAAGYKTELTKYIESRGLKYVTRADSRTAMKTSKFIREWNEFSDNKSNSLLKTEIGDTACFFEKQEMRMVVKKKHFKNTEEPEYWGLVTNDFDINKEELARLYAQRANSENLFSSFNQFGWKYLPMRVFQHNTVYLYVTAINYILFRYISKLFSSKVKCVTEKMELKTFTDKFMTVTTIWIGETLKFLGRGGEYIGLSGFT